MATGCRRCHPRGVDGGILHPKDPLRVGAALCVAHGLVHVGYVIPDPEDRLPHFSLETSWLLPEAVREPLGLALVALATSAFLLLGLAVWGVRSLRGAWRQLVAVGALASLLLLAGFPDVRLLYGVVVDLALLTVAVLRPRWIADLDA